MKESIKLELAKRRPVHAEGFVTLDLTDPITQKIKDRVSGKNTIFVDSLLSGSSGNWQNRVSACWMCLNDSQIAIDTNIPYLLGQTIGYGIPSQGTKGNYRGAYNLANQILAAVTLTKTRWKFQYDFTTPQANGTIRQVGLTTQFAWSSSNCFVPLSRYPIASNNSTYAGKTNDGRYAYSCSTAGIITIFDVLLNTTSTVDISAIVGTSSSEYKTVGYAPATGKYYIFRSSSTAGNRNMYVFSDNTFTTLESTINQSNNLISWSGTKPLYISGNYAYYINVLNAVYRFDFVNNVVQTTIDLTAYYNNASYCEYGVNNCFDLSLGTIPLGTTYIYMSGGIYYNSSFCRGIIYDIANNMVVGYCAPVGYSDGITLCKYPLVTPSLLCFGSVGHHAALSAYQLPSPVTKTSANGLTATYEVEVYW